MTPIRNHDISMLSLARSLWKNRSLVMQLAQRDVIGRYRGSFMGMAWSFFHPLLMLTVYTFVFSVVFKQKWGIEAEGGKSDFALILFVGMIVHGLLAEVINRAPTVICQNTNYVKRVIFPLEILPVITLLSALFHMIVSVLVLLAAIVVLGGPLHMTIFLFPVIVFPLMILLLGIAWFLASLGVYVRDVGQIMGVVSTVLLFVSPVFFPLSSVPEGFKTLMMLNPLTFIIEQSRDVLLFGEGINFLGLAVYYLLSLFVMWLGYIWFQKTRKGYADVL